MKNIWWNQVTNAVQFISHITKSLLEEKSILLRYTSGVPWRKELEEQIVETVKQQNSGKKFVEISAVDDPGAHILEEFCKPEKRTTYRPSKGYARFFAESEDIVLHDRYLWVKIADAKSLEAWMNFVCDYVKERGKNRKSAVFILEWDGEEQPPMKKGVKVFSFDEYIGEYDRIVFAVLASSSIKMNPFMKTYLAELVANVAGNDIELSFECIKYHEKFMKDPLAFILMTVNEKLRSDGTNYCYEKTAEEVDHLIWRSQIKIIYPYIEEFREEFVQKHANVISKQLPITALYGEVYSDPKDVELGTLKYMADQKLLPLGYTDSEKLSRYKEARNKLSHLSVLSFQEVRDII